VLLPRPLFGSNPVQEKTSFTFLNKAHTFTHGVDWNFNQHGKLWAYHLNYFEFLHQAELPLAFKFDLIQDYHSKSKQLKDGIEPYCISLRNLNLIIFLSEHQKNDLAIDELIGQHYRILLRSIEYHLRANHLLENACSLLVGAFYFRNENIYKKASKLLRTQLEEQLFEDGGHFERSPMYHMILLERLLDMVNVLKNNNQFHNQNQLLQMVQKKAGIMLAWASNMSCQDALPAFHDSTNAGKISLSGLLEYAGRLGVPVPDARLGDSNYRRFEVRDLCVIMDVGSASPAYQPGHYHAGIFNFVLSAKGKPCIVDTGISTYENTPRRHFERSTEAHNTVSINGQNQSEVWSSFRVGRRAHVQLLEDQPMMVRARHDGYKNFGKHHQVTLSCKEDTMIIRNEILEDTQSQPATYELSIHLHPSVTPLLTTSGVILEGLCELELEAASIVVKDYYFADDFNRTRKAKVIKVKIEKTSCLTIRHV